MRLVEVFPPSCDDPASYEHCRDHTHPCHDQHDSDVFVDAALIHPRYDDRDIVGDQRRKTDVSAQNDDTFFRLSAHLVEVSLPVPYGQDRGNDAEAENSDAHVHPDCVAEGDVDGCEPVFEVGLLRCDHHEEADDPNQNTQDSEDEPRYPESCQGFF